MGGSGEIKYYLERTFLWHLERPALEDECPVPTGQLGVCPSSFSAAQGCWVWPSLAAHGPPRAVLCSLTIPTSLFDYSAISGKASISYIEGFSSSGNALSWHSKLHVHLFICTSPIPVFRNVYIHS